MTGAASDDPGPIARDLADNAEAQAVDQFGRVAGQVRGLVSDINEAVKRDAAKARLERALAQLRRSEGK